MQTRASESVDVQLGEEQQAVDQEPEEENKIHHIRLLGKLRQSVALGALALGQCGFARVVGLPAGGNTQARQLQVGPWADGPPGLPSL